MTESFFEIPEKKIKTAKSLQEKKQAVIKKGCDLCELNKTCLTPKMKYTGNGKKEVLIIAEAPGKTEDEKGIQLIGQAGQILRSILKEIQIDLDEDCWKTNAIICRPEGNRTPTGKEIRCCQHNLMETIEKLKPKKIILLGKTALESYFLNRQSIKTIEQWIGWQIPDYKNNCVIFPTYHPSYLLRDENNNALREIFRNNIGNAFDHPGLPSLDNIEVTKFYTKENAIEFLETLSNERIVIDFETNSLYPYLEQSKILCMSIARIRQNKIESFAFPIFYEDDFLKVLRRILQNKKIEKIGQNIKFEQLWAKNVLKHSIEGWCWDTMLGTHILDNRAGITGLKFQAFVQYGVEDYDKEVKPFFVMDENKINTLDKFPLDKRLEYCGLDSYYEYKLYLDQYLISTHYQRQVIDFFMQGLLAFADMESNGIQIDKNYYHEAVLKINEDMNQLNLEIVNSSEARKYRKEKGTILNYNSALQLKELFFGILKIKSIKQTAKGGESTDAEVLEKIDSEFTKKILQYRKFSKLKETYISNMLEYSINKKVHPNYMLHTVSSYRSSCSDPNFMNIPHRDKEANKIMRSGIVPSPGNILVEFDYSGIEVSVSACYHKDPKMLEYINDPTTNMHRDMAIQIYLLEKYTEEKKYLRYAAKNRFVFPEFYGDYWGNCAKGLWEMMQPEDIQNLKNKGIKSFQKFENHIEDIEYDFWNNRFKVYNNWKEKLWRFYQTNGYIDFLTGFRADNLMNRKVVCNIPIQGSAFHCLLWSLIEVQKFLKYNPKLKSKLVGEIHDSMLFDMVPEEFDLISKEVIDIMCNRIKKYWDWIIVPLKVEIEKSDVNGNWFSMFKEEEE